MALDAGETGSLTFTGVVRESYYSGKDYTLEIEHPAFGTIQALVRAGGRTIREYCLPGPGADPPTAHHRRLGG